MFGVILHRIASRSMNLKEKQDVIDKLLIENVQWLQDDKLEITDVELLKKGTENQRFISVVVFFKNPAQAERARLNGMI